MMPEVQEVLNGDFLSARCTYNTTMRTLPTKIGNEKYKQNVLTIKNIKKP
jgi:hypothetical protein